MQEHSITNRLLSVLEGFNDVVKDVKEHYTRQRLESYIKTLEGIESDIYTSNQDGISRFKRHIEATGNYKQVEVIDYSKENDFFTLIYKDADTVTKERYSYLAETDSFMIFESTTY